MNQTRVEAAATEHGLSLLELRLGLAKVSFTFTDSLVVAMVSFTFTNSLGLAMAGFTKICSKASESYEMPASTQLNKIEIQ